MKCLPQKSETNYVKIGTPKIKKTQYTQGLIHLAQPK